jgi:hypothetical protein
VKTKILVSVAALASVVLFEVFRPRPVFTPAISSGAITPAATSIVAKADVPANVSAAAATKPVQIAPASLPVNPKVAADMRLAAEEARHPMERIIGKNNPFGVTEAQAGKIMAAMRRFEAGRKVLEAKLAYVEVNDPNEKIIVIPAYAAEAKPLIDAFVDSVASATNDETASKFMAQSDIGQAITATGANERVIDIRPDPTPGVYDITTTQETTSSRSITSGRVNGENLMELEHLRKLILSN